MENYDLALKLMSTIKKLKKLNMNKLHNCNITSSQMSMLHQIYYKNLSLEKPITVSQISKDSHQTLSATTQIINSLDKEGYIKREIDKDDRRIIRITLTKKGTDYIKEHHDKLLIYTQNIITKIGQEQTYKFIEIIEQIISTNMEGDSKND